jgi:hypothetical protein
MSKAAFNQYRVPYLRYEAERAACEKGTMLIQKGNGAVTCWGGAMDDAVLVWQEQSAILGNSH